jgi:striatin 1/3/4
LGPTAPSGSTQRASSPNAAGDKERESETDSRHVTTIYRPDDDGEWKEKLKQSREHSEQAQLAKENQTGVHAWELRRDDDDNDFKDSEADIEEEESSIIAEGDDAKVWKAKRTLRKSVLIKS